jgi:hypothetical protein
MAIGKYTTTRKIKAISVMKNTSVRRASKSKSYGYQNGQEGSLKKSNGLLSEAQNDGQEDERPRVADRRKGMREEQNNQCLDTWISFQAVEDLPSQPVPLEEYKQLSLWKSTPMRETSCDRTSQESQFTPISETTSQNQESLTSLPVVSPVQAQVMQELEQDYLTQSQHFGEKELDVLSRLNPVSVLSNNLKELSDEDFELFLADSIWQDTITRLKQSRQQSLERVIKDDGFLLFPTLTSGQTSSKMRPAGQTKCEKWFKDNGLIPNGSQLSAQAIASLMNFPTDWFSPLSPVKLQEELEPDILQVEPSPQPKQRSPSVESSISIPCLVKQPGQPEVEGVIKQDLGDRFLVDVDGEEISISKLFVYPDFSETVGQIEKNPSKISTPSKTRRRKGEGNGSIHWRTVTRNGKEYRQAYYHWVEDGKKRTKYIPKKLLDRLKESESRKLPIADILILLGGKDINPSKSSDTFFDKCSDNSESDLEISPSKIIHPSKKRNEAVLGVSPMSHRFKKRKKGYGTGYIECKPIKRSGKEYQQYWYHYEEWREGDRVTKKSKYIPKKMRSQIEKMDNDKVPVAEILRVLKDRNKRKI